MAQIVPDMANPDAPVSMESVISPSDVDKDAALQICVQDARATDEWITSHWWSLRWREADSLYQAPPGIIMWEGTSIPRANVNRFVVAETVNALHPQIMNGLFYETPAFVIRQRQNQNSNTARAISELLAVQMEAMNFRMEVDWGLFNALTFGTAIWKWGFKSEIKKVKKYVRVAEPVKLPSVVPGQPPAIMETEQSQMWRATWVEKEINTPTIENRDIRFVLVDPGCRVPDIRQAKFVIDRLYMTYVDLKKLADEEYYDVDAETGEGTWKKRYDLPSEEVIKGWFTPEVNENPTGMSTAESLSQSNLFVHHAEARYKSTTADPLNQPLEILERWDNDKVITVINRKKVIRNEPNEFGVIPFLSVNWWNTPDAFWGIGIGRVIGAEQRVQVGLINACLDLASLIVNPMFVRARNANIQTQQIRQRIGGIIDVDVNGNMDPTKAVRMLEQPVIPAELLNQIVMSQQRVERATGASEQLVMGAQSGGARAGGQMGRSGTGAAGIIQATMNRIGGFAEMFVRQVMEPMLYRMHEMNRDKLTVKQINDILGPRMGKDFKFDPADYFQGEFEFEVLAGSHLAARSQMAQTMFMMLQIFEQQPIMDQLGNISHKKVNVEELLHMVHDLSGFKNYYNIIVDMTPDEIQRMQMNSPAAQQAMQMQSKMALQNQKHGQAQQILDQETEARITRDALRQVTEKGIEPELATGTASATTGPGSQEVA